MHLRVKPVVPVLKTDVDQPTHKPLGTPIDRKTPNHFDNVFKSTLERS